MLEIEPIIFFLTGKFISPLTIQQILIPLAQKYTVWALLLTFLTILCLFCLNLKDIKKQFEKIRKRTWIYLLLIFLLAIFLRITLSSCDATDSKFWEYVIDGKNMLQGQPIKEIGYPKGYSFILMLIFLFVGMNWQNIILYNILISSFTAICIFLITYLISKNEYVSLLSALLFSLFPTAIFFSQFSFAEITSVFFMTLTLLIFIISIDVRKMKLFTLALLLLLFSITVRLENTMFILLFILGYAIFLRKWGLKGLILPSIIFCIFMIQLIPTYYLSSSKFGYIEGRGVIEIMFRESYPYIENPTTFSLQNIPFNLGLYLKVLTNSEYYPVLLYPFTFISLFGIKRYPKLTFPLVWILIFLMFYGTWFASSLTGVHSRQLLIHTPLAILIALGMLNLYEFIKERWLIAKVKKNEILKLFIFGLFFILIVFSFSKTDLTTKSDLLDSQRSCLLEDVTHASNMLEKNSCILVESSYGIYTNYLEETRFILPDKNIEYEIEKCNAMPTYYFKFKVSDLNAPYRELRGFYSLVLNNLMEKCELTPYTKLKTIEVYRVNC